MRRRVPRILIDRSVRGRMIWEKIGRFKIRTLERCLAFSETPHCTAYHSNIQLPKLARPSALFKTPAYLYPIADLNQGLPYNSNQGSPYHLG